tara:strand:+ start:217 stop:777 length:561 start_codon:yes stop_codon:yes gene_type:complete
MRIIGGEYKGKKIFFPKDKKTRPLRDMVKESIFNLIDNSNKFEIKLEGSNVLDLFSGSGSFGLECISRGADRVFFFENFPSSLEILKKNIALLKFSEKSEIFSFNCFDILVFQKVIKKKFDLIFIDPPFQEKDINSLLDGILEKKILNKNGIIIIHRHKKDDVKISKKFNIIDTRLYGISKIIIGN